MTAGSARRSAHAADPAALRCDIGDLLATLRRHDGYRPVHVTDVELTDGLRGLSPRTRAQSASRDALVLVRVHSQPLGLVLLDLQATDPERSWADAVMGTLGDALIAHLVADGARGGERPTPADLWSGWADEAPACCAPRRAAFVATPSVTIVIASREHPELLTRCLTSVSALDYPKFDVVVVDNAPATDRTRGVVRAFEHSDVTVTYLREDTPGLGVAHNRALPDVRGEIVAFTDDDVVVDRWWLSELVAPFVASETVAAVTGLILPAELETESQLLLEAHGRYVKGFEARDFDLGTNRPGDPLFPFTAGVFGAGANMAFRAEFLRRARGFDAALGTGTTARGGDDLEAFFRVVMAGHTLSYRPGAIVWHHHRRDDTAVRRQAFDYGVGLGAFLTSAVVRHPRATLAMMRRLPAGISLLRTREANRQTDEWPSDLEWRARLGLLIGPIAYAGSRVRSARANR